MPPNKPVYAAAEPVGEVLDKAVEKTELTDQERELVKVCKGILKASEDFVTPFYEDFVRYKKIYYATVDNTVPEDLSNIFVPYAYGQIESVTPMIVEAAIPNNKPVRTEARTSLDIKLGVADKIDAAISDQFFMSELENMIDMTRCVKDGAACGKGVVQIVHRHRSNKVKIWKEFEDATASGALSQVRQKKLVTQHEEQYEGPETEHVPILQYRPDPLGKTLGNSSVVARRRKKIRFYDLERLMTVDNEGNVVPLCKNLNLARATRPKALSAVEQEMEKLERAGVKPSRDLNRYVISCDVDEIHADGRIVWLVNEEIPVLDVEDDTASPDKDFAEFLWTVDPDRAFPPGMIEPCETMFYMLNDIENLTMDSYLRASQLLYAVNVDKLKTDEDLKQSPTGYLRLRGEDTNVNNVIMTVPVRHDLVPSMISSKSDLKLDIQSANGGSDYARGIAETRRFNDTASGIRSLMSAAKGRYGASVANLGFTFTRVWRNYHVRNRRYWLEEKAVRLKKPGGGFEYANLNYQDFESAGGILSFFPNFDPNHGDKETAKLMAQNLLTAFIQYQELRDRKGSTSIPNANFPKLMMELVRLNDLRGDPESYLTRDFGMSPSDEVQSIRNGIMPQPQAGDDHVYHFRELMAMLADPKLAKVMPPAQMKAVMALARQHKQATMQELSNDNAPQRQPAAAGT